VATSKATLAATDKVDTKFIDRAVARADTMGGGVTMVPSIQPCEIDGEEHFVMLFHPWSLFDLRTATSTGSWLDIQKAAAAAEGRNNPLFKGSEGMYHDVIIHKHRGVIRFNDYGAGGNVNACRNLLLGRQAAVMAFGSPGTGLRFDWHEETQDRGNQAVIDTGTIVGIKKSAFSIEGTSRDFGVIAMDSACADPG
jgi:N4-gp56 family major capsid protein